MRSTKKSSSNPSHPMAVALAAGQAAFRDGKRPLDNPHFGEADNVALFDAWSDGWLTGRGKSKDKQEARQEARWIARRGSLRGITASWAIR